MSSELDSVTRDIEGEGSMGEECMEREEEDEEEGGTQSPDNLPILPLISTPLAGRAILTIMLYNSSIRG